MCKFYGGFGGVQGCRFSHQFLSCRTGNHPENPLQKLTPTDINKLKIMKLK